jgi:type IV secretory pathway VirB6-like protein
MRAVFKSLLLPLALIALLLLSFSPEAFAAPSSDVNNNGCTIDPPSPTATGQNIITAVFSVITNIMQSVAQTFYTNIVTQPTFQHIVVAMVVLYLAIYGLMISFSMASIRPGDLIANLMRIGIVGLCLSTTGWNFFGANVMTPALGIMNQLLAVIANATGNAALNTNQFNAGNLTLDPNVLNMVFGPLTLVFASKFLVAIISLWTVGAVGWIMDFFIIWAMIEFILMIIGVVATYVKAIVGLAFLMGIAPLFIICVLFNRTRQLFFGWINQVVGFVMQPVLMFAFLGFYFTLIDGALTQMLYTTTGANPSPQFCYCEWFSLPGGLWTISWWRPTFNGVCHNGAWTDVTGAPLPPPFSMSLILYFVLLCNMGKQFVDKFLESLVGNLTQGAGPGFVSSGDVAGWLKAGAVNNARLLGDVGTGVVKTFRRGGPKDSG